jgi:hypothetical protein
MDTNFPLLVLALTGGCALVAAWPLLRLKQFRPALAGVTGSTCIGGGIAVIALLAGGFIELPQLALGSAALADEVESTPADAEEAETSSSAPAAGSGASAGDDPVIEASDELVIPPGRPEWVEAEPVLAGKLHTVAVSSGPFARSADCKRALDEQIVKAASDYIAEQLDSELARQLLRYDARTLRERFIRSDNVYHEVITTVSVGPMHQSHVLLEFGPDFRDEIERRWASVTATSRLSQVGLFAGGMLLLLGSVFSYFRLDNATRGYYTGRLQFLTAAAILAVVGAGALISRWITWL